MNSSFEALGLSEALVRAVTDLGYTQPTPVQLQAIPVVLAGGDLMAGAQTGTGKTAAFVLPILQRLAAATPGATREHRAPRVLILAPTRELAAQVEESVRDYGKHQHAKCAVIFGGVSIRPQFDALKRGVDIVVATPGRLLDHVGQKTIDLSKIEVLVLDEADRMLDMGFLPDMKRVFAQLPKQRQTLLFSATFSDEIRTLAATLLRNPVSVQATPRNSTVEAVDQKAISIERTRKSELLAHLIKDNQWFQVLVFTRTKHGANRLGRVSRQARRHRTRDSRQQEPERAHARTGRLQARRTAGAGRDGHRGPRARHRAATACRQFRYAERAGRLRAPHRPHGPSRRDRGSDFAGKPRGRSAAARHRAADQAPGAPHDCPKLPTVGRRGARSRPAPGTIVATVQTSFRAQAPGLTAAAGDALAPAARQRRTGQGPRTAGASGEVASWRIE